jgi:toxin HigB-1
VIRSYKNAFTIAIANGSIKKGFPQELVRGAQRKLTILEAAISLDDLRSPPSNKLHPLKEDRKGQHAIWINDQFRVCFRWVDGAAEDVEITDYH